MDFTKRKEIIVFILIFILVFFIGHNNIYNFQLNQRNKIESMIGEEKKKNDILKMIDLLDKELEEYNDRYFPTPEIAPLADKISQFAREINIEIEDLSPLPAEHKGQYIEFPLAISLRCGYHQLGELLSLIENNQEIILVKKIRMQKTTVPKADLIVSGLYLKK